MSSYYGGLILGLFCVTLLADRFGRKKTIQIGGCIALVGAILQTAAQNVATFFVGRVIGGMASGIMLTTVNVYQSEIAPPSLRGRMVSFQIVTLTSSGGLASWVGYACNYSTNASFSWYAILKVWKRKNSKFAQAVPNCVAMLTSDSSNPWMLLYPIFSSLV